MNAVQRGLHLVVLALCATSTCVAADRFGGSIAVTSDYVYRGISHSRGHWALQAGAHLKLADEWTAGVWGSTTDHNDPNHDSFEVDGFLSYRHRINADWQLQGAVTHYAFLNDDTLLGRSYDELSVGINFRSRIAMTLAWLPNAPDVNYYDDMHGGYYLATSKSSAAVADLNFIQPLTNAWSATAGAGYYDLPGSGYAYGHVGLTATYGPVDLQVLYVDSERQASVIYSNWVTGSRWSASVRYKF